MNENEFEIREYKKGDFNGIMEVWEETGLGNARRGDTEQIIEHSIEIGGRMLVLEDVRTGLIIGTSWMTFDGRRIHLHHIGVKIDYQNKGLGKQLTVESIEYAKEKGFQIKLEVHQSNLKAIEIYKKLGFAYLGDYDVYIIREFS